MAITTGNQKNKLYIDSTKVLRTYLGSTKIYSSGNTVTYCTDTGTAYTEEAEEGASCLSPKTFTPAKSGWEFAGWRQDKTASGSVLSSLAMRDAPVTLYAVFRQKVTVTYYNGSTSASSASGYRYYNNGNVVNPAFTLTPAPLSGWTFRGWAASSAAAAGIAYSSIAGTAFSAGTTLYAAYYQTITLSYNGNGNTGGATAAQTGTRYWNTGNVSNPTFTLAANGFSKTGYTFTKWALNGTSGTQYAAGASVALAASTVMYAVWTAAPFTLIPDASGWIGPTVTQGSFSDGPEIRNNPYGSGVEVRGTGATALPFAVGGFSKTINTRGLPKATIYVREGAWGGVSIGTKSVSFTADKTTATLSLDSAASQTLKINVNNGGDTWNVHSVTVTSIYFHN